MRLSRAAMLAALVLAAATAGRAQAPSQSQSTPRSRQEPGPDPLMGSLFPPELIMQNQQALRLSDQQKSFMLAEVQRTQTEAQPIAWRLQAAMEQLGTAVRQDRVDELQVLTQLDSVLALEREMKRTQIGLLVRLKNRLTPEQQAFLRGRMDRQD